MKLHNTKKMVLKSVWANAFATAHRSVSKAFGLPPPIPVNVVMDLTTRCNLRCVFCDIWKNKTQDTDPGLEDITRITDRLKSWLGNFQITFLGGEPFLRKDVSGILRIVGKKGIMTSFVTNGTLINEQLADLLAFSGVYGVNISLDSSSAQLHDRLRGISGTYDRVMTAINNLKASRKRYNARMRIGISSILCHSR